MAQFGTVLVAGGDRGPLVSRSNALHDAGFVVETAATGSDFIAKASAARPSVALLEDTLPDIHADALTRQVKSNAETANLPIMLISEHNDAVPGIDDVLERSATDAVLLARLQPLLRLATMRTELHMRRQTSRTFGVTPAAVEAGVTGDERVLVVSTQRALSNELAMALGPQVEIVLEGDPYQASENLEGQRFDAAVIVLDSGESREPQLYLCRHIRNNPRLFNLPVLIVSAPEAFAIPSEPYNAGASLVQNLPFDARAAATALHRLIARQRHRWQLRAGLMATLTPETADEIEGLYSIEFVRAHLTRLIARYHDGARPLSVAVFSGANLVAMKARFGTNAAHLLLQQMADFVVGLVRVEDLCARLSETRFGIVLPDADAVQAEHVVHRITAVLSHAEFHLSEEVCQPVAVWIQAGHASLRAGDSVDGLIGRAIAETL